MEQDKKENADLIVGGSFRSETEAKIESDESSRQKELDWKQIRRTRRGESRERLHPDEISSEDSVLSVDIIHCDCLCEDVGIGKRRKTDLGEADERERQGQQERNLNSEKTDED